MASISDPADLARLLGVAHEPIVVGDPSGRSSSEERADSRLTGRSSSEERADSRLTGRSSSEERADSRLTGRSSSEERADSRDPAGPEADPESVARKILLDQLTGRARSRSDLAKKLASKNVPADVATKVLDRFEEVGLIDDAAFAREWVAQRQEGKGLARRALAQELRKKGIDDELAREALDTVDTEDEVEAAHLLVARKMRSVRGLDQQVAIRRLVGMLARKGYSSSVSFRVVREALDADINDPEHSGL